MGADRKVNHSAIDVVFDHTGEVADRYGISAVPKRSPYRAGQWVRCHGYPGALPGPLRWGWRGVVLGSMGSTLLRGVTDDGLDWAEHWGALDPDAPRPKDFCVCCPHPYRRRQLVVEQLDLFAGVSGAA